MIVIKLAGGLGNQLFQYALGRTLAAKHQSELVLDISWYTRQPLKRYLRGAMIIFHSILSGQLTLGRQIILRNRRAFSLQDFSLPYRLAAKGDQAPITIKESDPFTYDPEIMNGPNNASYQGYFNSAKYFLPLANTLRQELTPRVEKLSEAGRNLKKIIEAGPAISLHIRRGDYLQPSTRLFHGQVPLTYYQAALKIIREKNQQAKIFVFSDEPSWCQANLNLDEPVTCVSGLTPYEDLLLMSLCKYHIIANSTFSWWGAWLSRPAEKVVIAPGNWLASRNLKNSDLFPEDWIIL